MQASRLIETGDASLTVAGGVESMSRAPWVVLKPDTAFPRSHGDHALDHSRLAHGQPPHAPAVDDSPRRGRRDPGRPLSHQSRAAGRLRMAQPPARPPGLGSRGLRRRGRPGGRDRAAPATRASAPTASLAALARLKPAFRPDGTVTAGNASPLSDGAAALLIGDGMPPGGRPRTHWPASPDGAWPPSTPTCSASGPSSGCRQGAGPSRHRVARPRRGRTQRSLRRPGTRLPRRVDGTRPGHRQPQRRRHRHRAPPRRLRRPPRWRSLAHELHRRGGGWGLAAICIGVGQGLAVVLEG